MLAKQFGKRLKILRLLKGVTQAQLAESVGVTVQYVGMLERGVSAPSFKVISRISRALGTEPANLFLFSGPEQQEHPLDADAHDEEQRCSQSMRLFNSPGGIAFVQYHLHDNVYHWSESMNQFLGKNETPLSKETLLDHVHADDRSAAEKAFACVEEGDPVGGFLLRVDRADIGTRTVLFVAAPENNEQGEPWMVNMTIIDVTEWKALEGALLRSKAELEEHVNRRTKALTSTVELLQTEIDGNELLEQKLRIFSQVFSASSDYMSFVDTEYVYRAVNESYERLFKLSKEHLVGRPIVEVLGEQVFYQTIKQRLDVAFSGRTIEYVSWFDFPGAGRLYMAVKYVPCYEDGDIIGVAVCGQDRTELKQLQDSLAALERFQDLETVHDTMNRYEEQGSEISRSPSPASSLSAGQAINVQKAVGGLAGDVPLYCEVASSFVDVLPGQLLDIKEKLEQGDCEGCLKTVMTMKSNFLIIGAFWASSAISDMEECLRCKKVSKAQSFFSGLEREAQKVQHALPAIVRELQPAHN